MFEYGETKLLSKTASLPGACWSLLYAVEIEKGVKFELDKTVEQLGLEAAMIDARVGEKRCRRTGTRRIFSVSVQSDRSAQETTLLTGE